MPYKISFVGLVCFYKEKDGGRLALLPDGRTPGRGIDPHYPHLIVPVESIEAGDGWDGDIAMVADLLDFDLPTCTLKIDGVADGEAVDLDATDHKPPLLNDIDMRFKIDPETAGAVVRLRIRHGTLGVFRGPGNAEDDPAVISQLDVPHDGPINITVERTGDPIPRTIRLKPGTEIVIANASRPQAGRAARPHFLIYEKLTRETVNLDHALDFLRSAGLTELPTSHPVFDVPGIIGTGVECGNTGCCVKDP